jgi:hypothetical protein
MLVDNSTYFDWIEDILHEKGLKNIRINRTFFIQINIFKTLDVIFYLNDSLTKSTFALLQLNTKNNTVLTFFAIALIYLRNFIKT